MIMVSPSLRTCHTNKTWEDSHPTSEPLTDNHSHRVDSEGGLDTSSAANRGSLPVTIPFAKLNYLRTRLLFS
jgi:hypothetical protein